MKTYDKTVAVDHVSFEIPKGSIFGLLGPNGAGKTSLIRIITSITAADKGQIWMDGQPIINAHSGSIGYMPEERGLYKKMKVGEQLLYLAQLKGLSYKEAKERLRNWMSRFEIMDWWNKKVEELSKGMQQKVQFISTVIHNPALLILDEPFSGLDPINTNLIKEEIRSLNRQGTSIIFSTHRMEQVEEMCEYIVLINKGRNVLDGRVREIKDRYKEHLFKIEYSGTLPEDLATIDQTSALFGIQYHQNHTLVVKVQEGADSNNILRYLIRQGVPIQAFNEILPSINEIFIRCVGES